MTGGAPQMLPEVVPSAYGGITALPAFPPGQAEASGCAPQMLPEVVPSVYGGMTADAFAALEGAPPAGDLKRVRQYVADQYAAIPDPERALGGASEADFAWALSVRLGSPSVQATLEPFCVVPPLTYARAVGAAVTSVTLCAWRLLRR